MGHQRCLQFEEPPSNGIENIFQSSNRTIRVVNPSLSATNIEVGNQESFHLRIPSARASVRQFVNSSQPLAALSPSCSIGNHSSVVLKPSGIGLRLNGIVNTMAIGRSAIVDMDSVDHYMASVLTSHLLGTDMTYESFSVEARDSDEEKALKMGSPAPSESCYDNRPSTLLLPGNNYGAMHEKRKFSPERTDHHEEFDKSIPKRKRKNAVQCPDSDGRKCCNCKKSKCLKLYCDCFAAGSYCIESCACQGCFNRLELEDTILETRRQIESRNPLAFAPKIVQHVSELPLNYVEDETQLNAALARHRRGCNCKKSRCLKKYCECYQVKVGCSSECRCEGCKNIHGSKEDIGSKVMVGNCGASSVGQGSNLNENLESFALDNDFSLEDILASFNFTPPTPSLRYWPSWPHNPPTNSPSIPIPSHPVQSLSGKTIFSHVSSSLCREGGSSLTPLIQSTTMLDPDSRVSEVGGVDDTPEILQEPSIPNIKIVSPNKKRVSPPHDGRMRELISNSSACVKSARRYIFQSVPSFPPLTPCLDSKTTTTGSSKQNHWKYFLDSLS